MKLIVSIALRFFGAIALTLMAMNVVSPARAAAKMAPVELTTEQAASVQRITDYINSYQSLRGEFVQISPRGTATRGVMEIMKPGKLRFEYEPPNPLLIVSDGKWLSITNKERNKGDQVPLSQTPLRFIVASNVNLLQDASVVGFDEANGFSTVAFAEKSGGLGGYIVLVFDQNRNELQQWVIVDGKGQKTTVQVSNLERDVALDPKLFDATIKRPEKQK
jgi:outer membrane lipoprotein-sorting protein